MPEKSPSREELLATIDQLQKHVAELENAEQQCLLAEATVRQVKQQNELLLKSAGEGIYGVDAQGNTTFVNPAAAEMLGWHPDELIGEPHHARIHHTRADGTPYPAEACPIYAAYRDGEVHEGTDERFWRKDGTSFPVAYTSTPIRQNGEIKGAVATFRDITRQKEAEAALHQKNADLQAANEALDAFAHTVAHDLKNPLAQVIGYTEILLEYEDLTKEQRTRALGTVATSGRRMSAIIDSLLLLASLRDQDNVPSEPIDMGKIVSDVRQRLAHMIKRRAAEIRLPPQWPPALGYAPWIEEVWANYLSNGLKYGGNPPQLLLGSQQDGDQMIRFWIQDRGPGLTSAEQARLFKPFTRIYQAHTQGHGLGLSIVRRIVTRLGGEVGVESRPGEGSTFWFTLPAA
jgi:PAS domain S-box-containing protein